MLIWILATAIPAGGQVPIAPNKIEAPITIETLDSLPVARSHNFGVDEDLLTSISKIPKSRPLSKASAELLASGYFQHIFGLCGVVSTPSETSDRFIFKIRVGIGGTPGEYPIVVNKKSGRVSCGHEKSFNSPSEFVSHLLTSRSTRTQPCATTVML